MSDYVRNKVIRVPVPEEIYSQYSDKHDRYDVCEKWLEDKQGTKYPSELNVFELEAPLDYNTDEQHLFYDFKLFHNYGGENDDFGRVRELTDNERAKYKHYFDAIGLDITKARYVDYCWYNCCDCQSYFKLTDDEFNKEI